MQLGNFSLSLAVKDLQASKEFYEKLGFSVFFGELNQKWLILKNKDVTIGLFEGMFENNIMTFNPGWDENAKPIPDFTDVRELHKNIINAGIEIKSPTGIEKDAGPASFMVMDPDGNAILIDQHV